MKSFEKKLYIVVFLIASFGLGKVCASDKKFVIITASYNNARWYKWNLDSVINQNYNNWRMIYIDDCSSDGTGDLVHNYINNYSLTNEILLIKNKTRKGALANQFFATHSCSDDEIVVILDGDDALAHPNVLRYLNTIYANENVWLTYGQFRHRSNGSIGFCRQMPDEVIKQNGFRQHANIPSHLRSYYVWLFKQIKKDDLLLCRRFNPTINIEEDRFLPMTGDMAVMLPLIEMAKDHFKFISDVLYIYNDMNILSDHRISVDLQKACDLIIRSRKPYEPLKKRP